MIWLKIKTDNKMPYGKKAGLTKKVMKKKGKKKKSKKGKKKK